MAKQILSPHAPHTVDLYNLQQALGVARMTHQTKLLLYRSHLLRMWLETSPSHPPRWRFSLEDVSSGARVGFADLDALTYHLLALMEQGPNAINLTDLSPSHDD